MNHQKLANKNIIIYETVSVKELIQLYQNAYALIFPSLLGPTSLPLFEALENNCPIITSNLEGHIEVLDQAAIYVDPLSEESILNSIKALDLVKIEFLKREMLKQKNYLEDQHHTKDWLTKSLLIFNQSR